MSLVHIMDIRTDDPAFSIYAADTRYQIKEPVNVHIDQPHKWFGVYKVLFDDEKMRSTFLNAKYIRR